MRQSEDRLKYRKLEKISEGSYATVFRGESEDGTRVIAIKERRLKELPEWEGQGIPVDVLREVSILRKLDHKNVCKPLQVEIDARARKFIIVLDFFENDLLRFYRMNSLDEVEIRRLAFEMMSGLAYLHSNRIVHRDIKPQNILVDGGRVKLSDFGHARELDLFERAYTNQVGTYAYRSPELAFGLTHYSAGVDIWALACVIAELATKTVLFSGGSDLDVLHRQIELVGREKFEASTFFGPDMRRICKNIKSQFSLQEKLSAALSPPAVDLLEQMLTPDPLDRIEAIVALKHAWFQDLVN